MPSRDQLYSRGLVNVEVSSKAGDCASETKQLKGEASKDSLYGTNSTQEYSTNMSIQKSAGKMGGTPTFS